ncbi:dihydropteroate synthase [Tenacibaculum discolor]|uniref:Dihydropteroate synthase n=1 Tax=Tenacibaculum discolor TaxID=361581 RepID=A0A2G1BXX2_9FLAO|nr:dihydropteroate synthase [Tenacibaculum discolor]MDP2541136.1 dihydropteroate synthase [Tenacibaculum discolor]PHN98848.1 dihydropteroate synthase [Tenacibaculum discolor]PHO00180.1 dihydropteroate synthase [Rhodobacteraceae bacterium 4F10]
MTINCKGTLVDLTKPKVMGILNVTPDSFFDGGKYKNERDILEQAEKMLNEEATFIDVGAYSSRPGAKHISEEEELQRMLPVVELLIKNFPEIIISIDSFRSRVVEESVNAGAAIINDISGGMMDEQMFKTVAKLQAPYIMMHMKGTPQNMQQNPQYENVVTEVISFFAEQLFKLRKLKVNDVIIDVGFGFGKTLDQNYELLKKLSLFKSLDAPILTGVSRKSMLYKLLGVTPKEALNATTVANTVALLNGTHILRVHDVKEAVEAVKIVEQL